MKHSLKLLPLALLSLAQASPIAHLFQSRQNTNITWGPCENYDFNSPLECGGYIVPIDWTDFSVGFIELELIRLRSSSGNPRGSIFVNFGGPGDNGRLSMDALAPTMMSMAGGCYDLISITPRGTNDTLLFDCYGSPELRAAVPLAPSGNSSDTARGQIWAEAAVRASSCAVNGNDTGRYIGTAFVARDHHAVAEALGEGNSFRYWGISYGTVLGATFAAMFSDKIDRMLLDGVVNAHEYYRNEEYEMMIDSDRVFEQMLTECANSPALCSFAQNRTAKELIDFTWTWLDNLKFNPVVLSIPLLGDSVIVTYTIARTFLQRALYSPASWPSFLNLWEAVLENDGLTVLNFILNQTVALDAEAQLRIKCGDVWEPQNDREEIRALQEARSASSRSFGDTVDIFLALCAQWQLFAQEKYRGNFEVNTSSPIMFVGNTADPVTPLAAARNMSVGFEGSVVLEHGGFGHSIATTQASRCTVEAIRAYSGDGTLPAPGTICATEDVEFGSLGWPELLQEMPAQCEL